MTGPVESAMPVLRKDEPWGGVHGPLLFSRITRKSTASTPVLAD